MRALVGVAAILLAFAVLIDAFETIVLPRRVARRFRFARLFFRVDWLVWRSVGRRIRSRARRESYLSFYGPLALLLLLITWAAGLILAFALLQWSLGSHIAAAHGEPTSFFTDLYFSGTTFFTLGLGDVAPQATTLARLATVVEAGLGFAFLALVISYLPVIYQSFSRREASISMLDARAGSPPTAGELLRRAPPLEAGAGACVQELLGDWERWAAELMETHLSYPVLAFFRSQHVNQSWLAALAAVMDTCAITIAAMEGAPAYQGRITYAAARHALIDLSSILRVDETVDAAPRCERLPKAEYRRLCEATARVAPRLATDAARAQLDELRREYEPYLLALSRNLLMPLPPWVRRTEPLAPEAPLDPAGD